MTEEIPSKDLFMMCKAIDVKAFGNLPPLFHFRLCRRDELEVWKQMHLDFPASPAQHDEYMQSMTDYYNNVYAGNTELFFNKCLFACNRNDEPIGRCLIWKAYGLINTIHWYKVLKDYEGRGIWRALLTAVMKELKEEDYPVYLHTHLSSYRAIKLYSDFGFCLVSNPVIGFRNNDLEECLPILQKYMPIKDFKNLKITQAPKDFLDAAASSKIAEF